MMRRSLSTPHFAPCPPYTPIIASDTHCAHTHAFSYGVVTCSDNNTVDSPPPPPIANVVPVLRGYLQCDTTCSVWIWFDGPLPISTHSLLNSLIPDRHIVNQLIEAWHTGYIRRTQKGALVEKGKEVGVWFIGGIPLNGCGDWIGIGVIQIGKLIISVGGGNTWREEVKKRWKGQGMEAILQGIVEGYWRSVEHLGERIEELEREVLRGGGGEGFLGKVGSVRRESSRLRRGAWGWRGSGLDIDIEGVLEVLEGYRDGVFGVVEVYFGGQNLRLGEVMQWLGVVTTMFVPLTFLAGIEGMNFQNQPELKGHWSYGAFWVVVVGLVVGEVAYFRKRGWL